MSDKNVRVSLGSGLSFGSILFFIFLILKLCHVIDWSWCWVTAPLWISFGIAVIFLILFLVVWAVLFK